MAQTYTLYVLICPIDHCVRYVGITSKSLEKRLKWHFWNRKIKTNPHKYYWIQKLKLKNLNPTIKEVASNLSEEKACQMEIDLISLYRQLIKKKLINLHDGGNIPPSRKNIKLSHDTKKKISLSKKGKSNANLGKKLTKAHCLAISQSRKQNKEKLRKLCTKPVLQFDKAGNFIQEFFSIKEADRKTTANNAHITSCCKGKRKTAGGFMWRYKNEKKE